MRNNTRTIMLALLLLAVSAYAVYHAWHEYLRVQPLSASASSEQGPQRSEARPSMVRFEEYSPLSAPGPFHQQLGLVTLSKTREYDLEQETFELVVPRNAPAGGRYGLLVWIDPKDTPRLKSSYRPLFEARGMIWVSAHGAGNKTHAYQRRMPLALDAAHNVMRKYPVDPARVYVAGFSGGARTASRLALHFPEVFRGAILLSGANHWAKFESLRRPGQFYPGLMDAPTRKSLRLAAEQSRIAFVLGEKEGLQDELASCYSEYAKLLKRTWYHEVPEMGHVTPPVESFAQALEFVDRP